MKKIVLCILGVFCLVVVSGCDEKENDKKIGGMTFTCIEHHVDGSSIYVHDQTNVIYIYNSGSYFTPLIKADGTAYTLEDYTKDCSDAVIYRNQKG